VQSFFEPIPFNLELADLPVKLSFKLILVLLNPQTPVRENIRQDLKKLLSPIANQIGMHFKFT